MRKVYPKSRKYIIIGKYCLDLICFTCILFQNEGMEAMYKLKVENIPGIVAVSDGKSI